MTDPVLQPSPLSGALLRQRLADLRVQFEHARDDCYAQSYEKAGSLARDYVVRAQIWDLAARCVANAETQPAPLSGATPHPPQDLHESRSTDGDVQQSRLSVAAPDNAGRNSAAGPAQVLRDGGDGSRGLSSARQAWSEPADSHSIAPHPPQEQEEQDDRSRVEPGATSPSTGSTATHGKGFSEATEPDKDEYR
jgi:hypothetical protein